MRRVEKIDERFGKYTEAQLECGLKVRIMEKKNFTSAHAVFGTRYGSIDTCFSTDGENYTKVPEGIAHFLEHKLFESEDGDAFSRFAETGAYCNAYTTFDRTCYLFTCSNNFYKNLEILLDFVQSPFFTAETVQKEQGIIGQEIKMYDDSAGWRVLFNMLGQMFENHPVKIDIAGTSDSIAKIDDKLLYECYNTFYNPLNMCICIAGNVDTDKTLELIEKNIKNNKPVSVFRKSEPEPDGVASHYVEQKLEVSGPIFCYGYKEIWPTPIRTQREKLVAELALELICGDCSRLYKELTDRELINDEFSSEYFFGPDYSVIFFDGESRDPKAVALAIDEEIKRINHEGIDDDLFEAVKKSAWGDMVRKFESLDSTVAEMIEGAFYGDDIFATGELIKQITKKEITDRLCRLTSRRAVLSVINRKD